MKYLAYLILAFTIGLNLYLYYPESQIMADPNDNVFQFSLVARTDWVWKTYGCPFGLSCMPNLVDHLVPTWAEGYPLPFYYSHVPQILIVSSYHLFIQPLTNVFHFSFSLFNYYHWITYLLLCFFPLSVFLAFRVVGFVPLLSALGALFAAHVSTDGLYGIDPPSFLWRGYGLTSQLYAMMWMPLAIAFVYRYFVSGIWYSVLEKEKKNNTKPSYLYKILNTKYQILLPIFSIAATTAGHLGMGILTILSTWPFLFIDLKPRRLLQRFKLLALIVGSSIFLLSYWIIPILLANNYHIISFWDPIWKFDSYGAYEVIRQFFAGEFFDWGRYPYITALVVIGWFAVSRNPRLFPFSILFAFWFLMYFGRTSWGGLIDLIPGMKDFHQHRFLVGMQIAGLFLIPAGLEMIRDWVISLWSLVVGLYSHKGLKTPGGWPASQAPPAGGGSRRQLEQFIPGGIFSIITIVILFFTIKQTVDYNSLNSKWIYEANDAFRYHEQNFDQLVTQVKQQAAGRIYAGRPGNWGKQLRIGSTELYMQLGLYGLDISQFLPETWSPLSENDQNFDERLLPDYDLLNIRTIVSDSNHEFPAQASLTKTYGSFQVYDVPTTGWFDVVSSPMLVSSDKTNFINIVHFWHRSYPRTWKMYPLISVEKNPAAPFSVERKLRMIDEVTYQEIQGTNDLVQRTIGPWPKRQTTNDQRHNIFSDFPFVFPDSTVSATLVSESVDKQVYSGTIEVPNPCPSCMMMFKMSYHPNWRVTVDGKPAEKYAVFPFYLATPATPGRHTVEWTYRPNTSKVMLLILECVSVAAVGGFFFWRKRQWRKRG